MKTLQVVSLTVVVLALSTVASAQRGLRGGGNYDVSTETTLTGTVDSLTMMAPERRGGGGLHLVLATSSGSIEVHVGPASFVSSHHVTVAKGDALTVVGSKVTMGGRDVLLAREIRKGDQVLTLRDARGFPLWAHRGGTQ
jgi:DNA/RNA endonuclease YhcR with UshA esterase domain